MLHMLMVDAVDASTLAQLQKSLQQISTLLALQRYPVSSSLLGLCMIKYPTAKDVQLQVQVYAEVWCNTRVLLSHLLQVMQVLQRPAPFSLRQWQLALQKLFTVQTACVPDSNKAGRQQRIVWLLLWCRSRSKLTAVPAALAVKSLVEHMATDKTLANINKSLTIVGHAFQSAGVFAKVLQVMMLSGDGTIVMH